MNFYERQQRNRRTTGVLILAFVALFACVGIALDVEYTGFQIGGPSLPLITIFALVSSLGTSFFAYYGGGRLVMTSLCAEPLRPQNPEHRQFANIVGEMAIAAGVPVPQLFVIPDPSPNALAAGRDPVHAMIGVTEGALLLLDREETQGVVAHEMAHIANRDTLLMTVVTVLLGGIIMLADWGRRSLYLARTDRRRSSPWAGLVVLLLIALSPLAARILAMAVSRQREYLADATAVEFTRNPEGLARALEKIAAEPSPLRNASRGTAHLFIASPLKRHSNEREGRLADLLSTHPPISRRVAVLRGMQL